MINRVVLVGRLTRDPELRKTNSDLSVASFTVALDNRQKNADGSKSATFVNCSIFGQQADNVAKYVRKGNLVGVEGRLNQRNFTTKEGKNASVLEVIADSVQFLEPKSANSGTTTSSSNSNSLQDSSFDNDSGNLDGLDLPDDELPF